jgi:hypothetical protein
MHAVSVHAQLIAEERARIRVYVHDIIIMI